MSSGKQRCKMNNRDLNAVVDVEVHADNSALSKLHSGQSLIVAEVDAMRSMAVAKPRDEHAIAAKIEATLRRYPGMAMKMRYCKPVGWKTFALCECGREFEAAGYQLRWSEVAKAKACPACGVKKVKSLRPEQQFARGLSVKAAEYLATEIMYCRTNVGVEKIDNDTYKVTATFFDVQAGRYNSREAIVSRLKKKWGGGVEREDDDRFFGLIIPAAQSKLLREMVNRAVPFVLRHVLEETVDDLIDQALSPEQVAKIIASFARFHITENDLETILGSKQEHWNHEDRKRCLEMFESLKSHEVTRDELLSAKTAGADSGQQAATSAAAGGQAIVSASDLEAAGKQMASNSVFVKDTPVSDAKPAAAAGSPSGLFDKKDEIDVDAKGKRGREGK